MVSTTGKFTTTAKALAQYGLNQQTLASETKRPGGILDVLKQMDVKSFDDLVAIMSLNRPGAKKFISGTYYERFRKKVADEKGPADPDNSPIGTYAENRNNPNSIPFTKVRGCASSVLRSSLVPGKNDMK